ncbi:hypothetical protein CF319_g8163 [Tilletia indica]|nr:hypothetical protein CF319_g8163 [Tilletia indica]
MQFLWATRKTDSLARTTELSRWSGFILAMRSYSFVLIPTAYTSRYTLTLSRRRVQPPILNIILLLPASDSHQPPRRGLTILRNFSQHSTSRLFQLEESASERFQCAADTKRVQTSARHPAIYQLPYRAARLTADQATDNVRGPHWLRAALLTSRSGREYWIGSD